MFLYDEDGNQVEPDSHCIRCGCPLWLNEACWNCEALDEARAQQANEMVLAHGRWWNDLTPGDWDEMPF